MQNLIVLTGPTAVGKTSLSIKLAQTIGGEIISADSMQVYKGLDIGTAKITKEEMAGVNHYLIDVLEPEEEFNVVKFQQLAKNAIIEIASNGHIPIICGGTGFYIQALLKDIDFEEADEDNAYREELTNFAKEFGNDKLFEKLIEIDEESSKIIDKNNVKRVIRALEYYHLTGHKISQLNEEQKNLKSPYNFAYFVLNDDRNNLYDRIDRRVDIMASEGLLDEVKNLLDQGRSFSTTAASAIGYKEIFAYLDGSTTYDTAIEEIKKNSRHLAKRQLTWFRREKDVIWLDKSKFSDDELLNQMLEILKEKRIY